MEAIEAYDYKKIESLLSDDLDPDTVLLNGKTARVMAEETYDPKLIELFDKAIQVRDDKRMSKLEDLFLKLNTQENF